MIDRSSDIKKNIINALAENEFRLALELSQAMTAEYPNDPDGWNLYALVLKRFDKLDQSISILTQLVDQCPESEVYLANLGNCFIAIGKIQRGIDNFLKAIEIKPDFINGIEALGLAYLEINKIDQAIECFKKILMTKNDHQRSLYLLGNINIGNLEWNKGIEYLSKSNFGLSQSHLLECFLCTKDKNSFISQHQKLIENKVSNPLIGSIIQHASIYFNESFTNPFCRDSVKYIYQENIDENELNNNEIINIIKYSQENINNRSQDLLQDGQQSAGNIFSINVEIFQKLRKTIEKYIYSYKERYKEVNEGFLNKWPDQFTLYGWIVTMKKGGYLKAHIHKEGWISGSFYLNIPDKRLGDDSGNIAFSVEGPRYPSHEKDIKKSIVKLKTRDICIFPSSLFHETIPFNNDEERVTLAFDVIPVL